MQPVGEWQEQGGEPKVWLDDWKIDLISDYRLLIGEILIGARSCV